MFLPLIEVQEIQPEFIHDGHYIIAQLKADIRQASREEQRKADSKRARKLAKKEA